MSREAAYAVPQGGSAGSHRRLKMPAESVETHTRILRCMLAADDCQAYWQNVDTAVPVAERAAVAFQQRWFGTKSEARVRTLVGDMVERFDRSPTALSMLQGLGRIPEPLRSFVCHLHTQLADPIYRAFTGEWLPQRRAEGRTTVDRLAAADWVESLHAGRWSSITRTKFASNLLATAVSAGLATGARDPRTLGHVAIPDVIAAYALHLLREVRIEGTLTDNPYVRSLGLDTRALAQRPGLPGVRVVELGGAADVVFDEPTMHAWGLRHLAEAT